MDLSTAVGNHWQTEQRRRQHKRTNKNILTSMNTIMIIYLCNTLIKYINDKQLMNVIFVYSLVLFVNV